MEKFKITSKIVTIPKPEVPFGQQRMIDPIVYDNEITFDHSVLLQNQQFYNKQINQLKTLIQNEKHA